MERCVGFRLPQYLARDSTLKQHGVRERTTYKVMMCYVGAVKQAVCCLGEARGLNFAAGQKSPKQIYGHDSVVNMNIS